MLQQNITYWYTVKIQHIDQRQFKLTLTLSILAQRQFRLTFEKS